MDIRTLLDKDTTAYDAYEELSNHGFSDAGKALANLRYMAEGVEVPLLVELLSGLLRACSLSADPDLCLNSFERVSAASESRESFLSALSWEPESIKLLAPVLASSRFLTTYITGEPESLLGWLLEKGRLDAPRTRETMAAELAAACPPDTPVKEAMTALREYKYREFLRLTVRDLLGVAELAETTRELSDLADACLDAAIAVAGTELEGRYGRPEYTGPGGEPEPCPFTVIALGKLGGQDLNYSSDIDVMFIYLTDNGTTSGPSRLSNHQYFIKLSELVTKLIGDKTSDGFVFRVDTRLRPEGERGELALSLHSCELYYEAWGQTWERSALIKARPCAGDMDLGRAFTEMVRPFVFRKYLDYGAISEIRDMKEKVERSAALKKAGEIDLKLGAGGIREVEFFVSCLQLIYAGRDPGIRERNTMKALHRLALKDLISFEEQNGLTRAYEFLRTAEHRLQVVDERQTHSLPDEDAEVRALALRMGYRDADGLDAGAAFRREHARHTRRVRSIYDGLFADRHDDEVHREPEASGFEALLSMDATAEEASAILSGAGFRNPARAWRNVTQLRDGSAGSPLTPRSRMLFMSVIPAFLDGCSNSPDPDMALNNLETFVDTFGSREALAGLIKESPDRAALITKLFGSSDYFSKLLILHPEMSDLLLLSGAEGFHRTPAEMADELSELLARPASFAEKMDVLRRFKHTEELRIGIRDVYTSPGYRAVSHGLAALAETVLSAALSMAFKDTAARYGLPAGVEQGRGVSVAGFGKLGGRELSYGSDLDIIFIYDNAPARKGKGISRQEFFARLSERVIFALSSLTREGQAFRVDTRLRPGGSKGVLVHTLDGLRAYYAKSASLWEFQALTRARAVAGDPSLSEGFESLRLEILGRDTAWKDPAAEVRAMRRRMERELGKKGKGGFDIKYGRGGIVDVEFVAQYMQIVHGPAHMELLSADTVSALSALPPLGLMTGEDSSALVRSYDFFREIESKLRMTTSTPESRLPEDGEGLAALAARLGYTGSGAADVLYRDCGRHAEATRRIFERVLQEPSGGAPR
ncbi:MAG: bifunctional [glutamate--ammonia ligase]-adenylyl-L-tyrosine phosphorylase/[glutamate--ammonia-ligase] adenylyltransferase [Nitrospirae bacterium]|nr:bifunctional [glutamate--ammonia ligase]-adenylyl-L-tyrosine phosphorylase/[glutamate--ammonia-ligase] adenylyltransferase [Nitrospirota bacterium]